MICGPAPAYQMAQSSCGTCPTCCSAAFDKKTVEKIRIALPWAHRFDGGTHLSYKFKSAVHTVKDEAGASLTTPAYDVTKAYVADSTVTVGTKVYVNVGAAAAIGMAPWIVGSPWVLQTAVNTALHIDINTDNKPVQAEYGDRRPSDPYTTVAFIAGGVSGTSYRVDTIATFTDCEGREVIYSDCAMVSVKDC